MKICVTGGSGVIGSKLVDHFTKSGFDVDFTYMANKPKIASSKNWRANQLDITNRELTLRLLQEINPDIVIHTAAVTNVDLCQTDKELAENVNIEGTRNIVDGCKLTNSNLIYVSTSFVFDGTKDQYVEEDKTSPRNHYGYTKQKGEEFVINSGLESMILRTDQPYCWTESWQHTNSVLRVVDTLQAGKTLDEVTDWYNTPTYIPDFVDVTSKLIQKKSTGIFHVVGRDYINRYDWSKTVAEIFVLDQTKIRPIKSDKLSVVVKRVNVNLKNDKTVLETGLQISGVREGTQKMLNDKRH